MLYSACINFVSCLAYPQSLHIWLGGLFTPEAYITATRQYVAQANSWSLEELYLDVSDCMYINTTLLLFMSLPSSYSLTIRNLFCMSLSCRLWLGSKVNWMPVGLVCQGSSSREPK